MIVMRHCPQSLQHIPHTKVWISTTAAGGSVDMTTCAACGAEVRALSYLGTGKKRVYRVDEHTREERI